MPPLLAGAAHLMNQSRIKAIKTLDKGICLFTLLVANPSTGKSPALALVTEALENIEEYDHVEDAKSSLVNGNFEKIHLKKYILRVFFFSAATVEALLHLIGNLNNVASFWDEASTFFSSFGLYKSNGKTALT